jgi:biotin-dependent carboxylase-like uncharacterized protein
VALLVENPGPRATVQDLGRPGFRDRGVPVSGAFDRESHALANALLANPPDVATLELTLVGGTYRAEIPLALALAGAPMTARVEGPEGSTRSLQVPQTFSLRPDDRLLLGGTPRGARTYLAVKGGWRTPLVLGSRSHEAPLRAGDRLSAAPGTTRTRRPAVEECGPDLGPLRILDGPDAGLFEPIDWEGLEFRVDLRSDRIGLRLDGPALRIEADPNRTSGPVAPGAVQVAGGRPIVLGPACGTMGGYPLVAHVASAELDRLAQARPGDVLRFRRIDLAEARRLDRAYRRRLADSALRIATLAADPG